MKGGENENNHISYAVKVIGKAFRKLILDEKRVLAPPPRECKDSRAWSEGKTVYE